MNRFEMSMRPALLGLALITICGCGEDDPVAPVQPEAQVLGVMELDQSGGVRSFPHTLAIIVTVGTQTPDPALLFRLDASPEMSGSVKTVDAATNPEFADAVSLLVNGEDNVVEVVHEYVPGGGGGSRKYRESALFKGGIFGDLLPDFAGAEITHLVLVIDEVSLDRPGSDPNGDGLWTDYLATGRVVIMGHP